MTDERAQLKERAWETVRQFEPAMRELALRILGHPELGYAEVQACRWLTEPLEQEGFEVDRALGGLPTAFRACQGSDPGPTVAFLAEYDALPGVGHGCGHNLIGPAAVGAALGVAAVLSELGGQVCVIGTPAEEFLGQVEGKIRLLEAGAFDEVEVALMMHPQYEFRLPGRDLGFIACELHFHGRPAHAATDPWHGANALDGLLLTFNNINALRQHLRPEIRVHGIVTEGGQAPNIVPERASASLMVRAPDPEQLEVVYRRVQDCARAGALASDTRLQVVRVTTVYNSITNPTLNDLIAANLALLGETMNPDPLDISGSSDFGSLSQLRPAAMFWAGTHPQGMPWHSAKVARASGQEMALRGMVASACALAGVAVDLLGDRGLLEQARADFVAARG
jgi:amidohydrolase